MLDWCKNTRQSDQRSEILIPPSAHTTYPPSPHALHSPTFINRVEKTIRRIKPHPKKNNNNTKTLAEKIDKQVQVAISSKVAMMDSATQTNRLNVELASSIRPHSYNTSPLPSPSHQFTRQPTLPNHLRSTLKLQTDNQLPQSRKRSFDLKLQTLKTKATYCLAQTKKNVERGDDNSKMWNVKGVESYHFQPTTNRSYEEAIKDLPLNKDLPKKGVRFQESQVVQHEPTYQSKYSKYHEDHQYNYQQYPYERPGLYRSKLTLAQNQPTSPLSPQLSYSHKYRQIYNNIQSQFKFSQQRSQKRRSERKIKVNHNPRILFQRETIVSYTDERKTQSREMLVEQSVILERESRSMFTPVGETMYYGYFSCYLARENRMGMLVSVKQIPSSYMDKISQELLIYKELQENRTRVEGLLTLYQTQIDYNSYLLIKEPYTQTLKTHLATLPELSPLILQLQSILNHLQSLGYHLLAPLQLQDVVLVLDQIKIQNASIFTLDIGRLTMDTDTVLQTFRNEMLQFLS